MRFGATGKGCLMSDTGWAYLPDASTWGTWGFPGYIMGHSPYQKYTSAQRLASRLHTLGCLSDHELMEFFPLVVSDGE